jgi:nitroreductase
MAGMGIFRGWLAHPTRLTLTRNHASLSWVDHRPDRLACNNHETLMSAVTDAIRDRHSSRRPFDPSRPVTQSDLTQIFDAARWAPTPCNMQNFEIIVVDDVTLLKRICAIPDQVSERYLRENFEQLSFGEEKLRERKAGMLAADFPKTWTDPENWNPKSDIRTQLTYLGMTIDECQTLVLVTYDKTRHAPGSENDALGHMSLGCVMQNMWLASTSLGIGIQMLTVFSEGLVEKALKAILRLPETMAIAFACSVGYPSEPDPGYLRVRRDLKQFVHHNRYGNLDR